MPIAGVPISDTLSAPSALSSPRGPTGHNFYIQGLLTNPGSDLGNCIPKGNLSAGYTA